MYYVPPSGKEAFSLFSVVILGFSRHLNHWQNIVFCYDFIVSVSVWDFFSLKLQLLKSHD